MATTKLAIMQPYFLPYLGYFQLIAAADQFIVYDNIKYTKKGWINRNHLLQQGKSVVFSLPLKSDSDYLTVSERELAPHYDRQKLLRQFKEAYHGAPYLQKIMPLLDHIISAAHNNLFDYVHHSIVVMCKHLNISTPITIASTLPIDHTLKGEQKVLALCQATHASTYINAIGGVDLYAADTFKACNIDLKFIKTTYFEYKQLDHAFVPSLSIIDLMMFGSPDFIDEKLFSKYTLMTDSKIQALS